MVNDHSSPHLQRASCDSVGIFLLDVGVELLGILLGFLGKFSLKFLLSLLDSSLNLLLNIPVGCEDGIVLTTISGIPSSKPFLLSDQPDDVSIHPYWLLG